ncbi:Zinc finger protein ZAT9 [Linum grandiflorum]
MTRHIQYTGPAAATTITKPRSYRRRRLISTIPRIVTTTTPVSNVEEGTMTSTATSSTLISAEEVAAWSLVMYHHDPADSDEENDNEKNEVVKEKSVYKCNKCPKRFGSYQALGGHHASHSKNSASKLATDEGEDNDDDDEDYKGDEDDEDYDDEEKNVVKKKEFKCPFCPRVFWSGQALGGHKKVHNSYHKMSSTTSSRRPMIDLNLPPPVDDDEDVE